MKSISYGHEAAKTMKRLPADTARLIDTKLRQYAADPRSLKNNVKALQGAKGLLRLRVGDWRVIFTEDGAVVAVIKIAPRGSAYD